MLALLVAAAIANPEVILGGFKQMILGLQKEPPLVLSHYVWVEAGLNKFGTATDTYAQRLGYTACEVKETIFNNQVVWLFDTDARTKRDRNKEYDAGVGAGEKAWIAKDGHILKQTFTVEMPKTGQRVVEAVYGTKTVELSCTEDGKTTNTTLYPTDGCQPFFDRFKPMFDAGKSVLKDKKFYVLDPYTLGYKEVKIVAGSRFEAPILLTRMKGNVFNITVGDQRRRIYITDFNELVKVDLSEDTYLQIDSLPSRLQPGGGGK